MKILYIYKDYMKRRKSYGKMMTQCGHDVVYLEVKKKKLIDQIALKIIDKHKPDIIWFQNVSYVKNNTSFVEYAKHKNIPIVIYFTFVPQERYDSKEWMGVWKKIDYLFIHSKHFHNFLKENGLNSYYMPLGFYPDQYYKINNKKKYDVSFCGMPLVREDKDHDKRAIYIRSLKKHKIAVYGDGFNGKVGNIPVYKYKTHEVQNQVYSKTIISLDLPFFSTPDPFYMKEHRQYHVKNRFFEIPASGNFLLTVRCPEFLEIFGEDTVGYYDDSIESLRESVARYLKDKDLRNKMIKKAYKLVSDKHTYLHRFKDMFKIILQD